MRFSQALDLLYTGKKLQRSGWSKANFIYLCIPTAGTRTLKLQDNTPWVPSTTDVLAEDWQIAT